MDRYTIPPRPTYNRLITSLPPEDVNRLLPHLDLVAFKRGAVLYEPHGAPTHLYFPTTVIVSLVYTMSNGATAAMGIVGNDGVVGVALFLGGQTSPNLAVVQVAGSALRLPVMVLHTEFQRGAALQQLLLCYTQALLTQISQTAVCNRLHPIEQRLCRWLLLTCDRARTDAVYLTHEFLGYMLGVRRESITTAARHLQTVGLIRYHRGRVVLLDRPGLEMSGCECYRVVKDEYSRLLG